MKYVSHSGEGFRAAATDVDQTLKGGATVSLANIEAVDELKRRNLIVLPATGRIYQQTVPFHTEARLNGPLVCSDGALVRSTSGKVISKSLLPKDIAQQVRERTHRNGVTTLSHLLSGVCVTSKTHWPSEIDRHRQELGDRLMFYTPADISRVETLKIICSAPAEQLDDIESWVREDFAAGDLTTFRHHGEMLDLRPAGVSKVTGLAAVAEYLDIDPRQFMAFGDGANDVEMLAWAGLAAAMYHGSELAKASAHMVASSSSAETDFAAAIAQVIATHWNQEKSIWSLEPLSRRS